MTSQLTRQPYSAVLQRRPYAASMATSAVLFGGGDMIAQQAIEKKGLKAHDVRLLPCLIHFPSILADDVVLFV